MVAVVVWHFLSSKTQECISRLLSVSSLLFIGLNSYLYSANMWGAAGACLVAVSGLVLGENRTFFKFPAVDWFHYLFASALVCLTKGLL